MKVFTYRPAKIKPGRFLTALCCRRHFAVADPEFAKGEHGERVECEPKRGSGGGAPSGVGQSLCWEVTGQGASSPFQLKSFCPFSYKKN